MKRKLSALALVLCLLCTGCASPKPTRPVPTIVPASQAVLPTQPATEQTEAPETAQPEIIETEAETPWNGPSFQTTDLEGNPVTEELLQGHRLVMLNLWEPWCGPCVGEMPELQRLYEAYRDQGFLIVGVFRDSGAEQIAERTGVQYPLIHFTNAFAPFETNYVPTTVFLDAQGNLVGEQIIGANSYDAWASMVEALLG